MKKVLFFSVLCLFSVSTAFAADDKDGLNPIYTGVPFLSITPDARAGGMGDAGVASSADVNSQYWNPAKYATMESAGGIGFSFTPWMNKIVSDINLSYLAGYWKIAENQALSASLRYFSLGEVNLTEQDGTPMGTTQPYDFAIDAAYSRMLSEKWSAAVALRYIYSDLGGGVVDGMTAGSSVAADIAALYKTPIAFAAEDGLISAGLNISNIGTKISYDDGNNNLFIPTNMRLGGSLMYPFDKFNTLTLNVDANKLLVPSMPRLSDYDDQAEWQEAYDEYNNESVISGIFNSFSDAPGGFSEELKEIAWAIGLEYAYNNQFFVRGGYFTEHQTKGNRNFFTAGVGFKLNMFQLDAAYVISVAQTSPLDQTLRFSLAFDMNGLKDLMK
jgi:hypothetical protein